MRKVLIAAASLAALVMPMAPIAAQSTAKEANLQYQQQMDARHNGGYQSGHDNRDDHRYPPSSNGGYAGNRDRHDDHRSYSSNSRDYRQYRSYDYNRFEPGQRTYYADRYYRDGRYYQPRHLGRNDRIYRGSDNRYYCRRSDGTTGLIIGGITGGLFGNAIAGGGSRLLGTLLGGAGGALLGQSIDRGQVTCR